MLTSCLEGGGRGAGRSQQERAEQRWDKEKEEAEGRPEKRLEGAGPPGAARTPRMWTLQAGLFSC